jgi:hypothetical protein
MRSVHNIQEATIVEYGSINIPRIYAPQED